MKAILKATGETVEVNSSGTMSISCGAYCTNDGRTLPATALEFEKVIDWEQRRYELIKELFLKWTGIDDIKREVHKRTYQDMRTNSGRFSCGIEER